MVCLLLLLLLLLLYNTVKYSAFKHLKIVKSLQVKLSVNHLNVKLHPIFYLLALLVAHHILHVSRIRVKFICCHFAFILAYKMSIIHKLQFSETTYL